MNRVLLSTQAYSDLISLPPAERLLLGKALLQLKRNPELGLKLWGKGDLYLYQTVTEAKVVYRLSYGQVQVLGIKASEEHHLPPRAKISAVVLAAGRDDYGGSLPLSYITEAFLNAGIDDLTVVLGYRAEQAKNDLQNKDVKVVVNPDYEHGLSKSLRYGLRMVPRDAAAVMLALGNRPFVKPKVVAKLAEAYRQGRAPVVVPIYSHLRGHPVVFDSLLIPELLRTRGDIGGRGVLRHHSRELKQVEVGDIGILRRMEKQ
jgi:CTP:molybdopterin cytidylyltransferase MocA